MTSLQRCLPSARAIRVGLGTIFVLTGLLVTGIFIHQLILPLLAIFAPQLRTTFYDLAVYGVAPTRKYVSLDLQSPEPSVLQWHDKCDDDGLILIGPYGDSVPNPGPTILDARGNLVWTTTDYGLVTNFQMQEYKGEQLLTFWSGHKEGAKGRGAMYMLNSKYELVHKLQAVGENLFGDLHEFQLTNDGTALITVYNDTTIDMRNFGFFRGEHGWVTDCIFQEIDIETGELLFQWVASEHVRAIETHYFQPAAGFSDSNPFDFFHLNSIQKDSRGNYLISSRHFHTITYIDGASGDIIWTLGADSSDFEDISERKGAATEFCWSHHARWVDEESGIISLFNNGAAGPLHLDRPHSKGMMVQVNEQERTVKHLHDFQPLQSVRSHSQGGVQVLPNKDEVFIGWGSSAMWSQFEMDGTLLCETHYGASLMYFYEWVKSYRIFKVWGWVGEPQWPPSARIRESRIYVSWNGATEVKHWELQGQLENAEDLTAFHTIETVDKEGFETAILLPQEDYARYRIAALDTNRKVIRHSDPIEPEEPESMVPMILGACAAVLFLVGVAYVLRCLLLRKDLGNLFPWRRRGSWSTYQYSKL